RPLAHVLLQERDQLAHFQILRATVAKALQERAERQPTTEVRVESFRQDHDLDRREAEVAEDARGEFDRLGEVAVGERLAHHRCEGGEQLVRAAHHAPSQRVVATTASLCRAVWTRYRCPFARTTAAPVFASSESSTQPSTGTRRASATAPQATFVR